MPGSVNRVVLLGTVGKYGVDMRSANIGYVLKELTWDCFFSRLLTLLYLCMACFPRGHAWRNVIFPGE